MFPEVRMAEILFLSIMVVLSIYGLFWKYSKPKKGKKLSSYET